MIPQSRLKSLRDLQFLGLLPGPWTRSSLWFRNRARLKIWAATGMPLRLGIASGPEFRGGGSLALDAAFAGNVIWIGEEVFDREDWEAQADWLLRHEILHAKIAIARLATRSGTGKRRYELLAEAASDALRLIHVEPALRDLSALLAAYRENGFDDIEEALVRYTQLLDAGEQVPVTLPLLRARHVLSAPWGWSPLTVFRTLMWLPVCGWTARRVHQT